MTILRLPGGERLTRAAHLATEDDASVAGGLFTVTVRPWKVMLEEMTATLCGDDVLWRSQRI